MTWDDGGADYNSVKAGTYRFTGSLEQVSELENPINVRAVVDVKVGQPVITEVEVIEVIKVANGTDFAEIGLPSQVEVTLNNGGLAMVDVEWSDSVPRYEGKNQECINLQERLSN